MKIQFWEATGKRRSLVGITEEGECIYLGTIYNYSFSTCAQVKAYPSDLQHRD